MSTQSHFIIQPRLEDKVVSLLCQERTEQARSSIGDSSTVENNALTASYTPKFHKSRVYSTNYNTFSHDHIPNDTNNIPQGHSRHYKSPLSKNEVQRWWVLMPYSMTTSFLPPCYNRRLFLPAQGPQSALFRSFVDS